MKDEVYEALQAMRPPFALYEWDIHQMVAQRLTEAGIDYVHEAKIGPGCRIDYLAGDVGIEVKKGKPTPKVLVKQLQRYAACELVSAVILVTQQSVKVPAQIAGKPVRSVVLSQLWGVALP